MIALHGYNRFLRGLDILVDPSPANTRKWISALANLPDGATKELADQDDIFEREGPYVIRVNDECTVDVMFSACGHAWSELKGYVVELIVDDGSQSPVLVVPPTPKSIERRQYLLTKSQS
jgi:hypothetical protein